MTASFQIAGVEPIQLALGVVAGDCPNCRINAAALVLAAEIVRSRWPQSTQPVLQEVGARLLQFVGQITQAAIDRERESCRGQG